jgi:branched-subunit amino acid aminotransferase/4-amino-4-deoxychorismate lyase
MHKFVSFNQKILIPTDTNISAISSSALYGKGVFTTVLIHNSKPFLWEKHWRRLTQNAEKLGIDLSEFSQDSVKDSLAEIIKENQFENGRARITFFDESPSKIWSFDAENKTSLLIATDNLRKLADVKLTVSPYRINSTSPIANTKSCNYLEKTIALQEAKKLGFDEAICLNEKDEIVSGIMANIYWVKNNKIYTPSLETGCLAGTIREFLLENFEINEVKAKLPEIENADEIFLSSSGIGLSLAIDSKKSDCFDNLKKILDLETTKA